VAVGDEVLVGKLVGVGAQRGVGHFLSRIILGGAAGAEEEAEEGNAE